MNTLIRPQILFLLALIIAIGLAIGAQQATAQSVHSWQSMRDQGVVKQQHDRTCGAAAVATILKNVFKQDVTELDVRLATGRPLDDIIYSMADLERAVKNLGFNAFVLPASLDDLYNFDLPSIAYLLRFGRPHFTVVRGLGEGGTVRVADPSLGNVRFKRHQFEAMFKTRRQDQREASEGDGLLMFITSADENLKPDESYFGEPSDFQAALRALSFLR